MHVWHGGRVERRWSRKPNIMGSIPIRAFSAFGDQVALSGANTLLPITRDIKHDCGATTSLLLALYSV